MLFFQVGLLAYKYAYTIMYCSVRATIATTVAVTQCIIIHRHRISAQMQIKQVKYNIAE